MPFYENVFIARQDISSTQAEALADQFANLIAEQGGKVTKKEHWGLRNIAYRIAKNRKGHYVLMNIDGPPAALAEMERQMRISEDVLRYLTVRVDELEEGPSAMLQSRQRDDGPGAGRGGFGGGREGGFGGGGGREGGRSWRDREDRPRRDFAAEATAPTPTPTGDAT
jgi:small subunit ribosomal protein S6